MPLPAQRRCDTCEFWERSRSYGHDGSCRRRAPVVVSYSREVAIATELLLWWYARDHSDEKTANLELENHLLSYETREAFINWPYTLDEDWCGDWKENQLL
jgi:hypothetical protein